MLHFLGAQMSKRKQRRKPSRSPIKLLSKAEVEEMVKRDDRWALLKAFLVRVPPGTRRFADVNNVGPVVEDPEMKAEEWDAMAEKRKTTGQCKGCLLYTSPSPRD